MTDPAGSVTLLTGRNGVGKTRALLAECRGVPGAVFLDPFSSAAAAGQLAILRSGLSAERAKRLADLMRIAGLRGDGRAEGGARWLFAVGTAILGARQGATVAIDNIEAGLHHSVLPGLWSVLLDAAAERALRVFASTHSSDCWAALTRVASERTASCHPEVKLVLMLRGGKRFTFSLEEMSTALDGEIDLRGGHVD
ncbi:MAG: ATP-binding protein [Desulfurellales bacterium]|nr:MAG: ATP-binding protein [Desulfurellales bacterium]